MLPDGFGPKKSAATGISEREDMGFVADGEEEAGLRDVQSQPARRSAGDGAESGQYAAGRLESFR
jgi:hypothetical protein